jgi:hypothetical protein
MSPLVGKAMDRRAARRRAREAPPVTFRVGVIQLAHVEILTDGAAISEDAPGGQITVTRRGSYWRVEGTNRYTARSAARVLVYIDKLQREAARFAEEARRIAAERG